MLFIKRILVTGKNMKDSAIVFEPGLNIVHGPSNTGKSYIIACIDYALGAEELPFSTSIGYDMVQLDLSTEFGTISIQRELTKNKVEIISSDKRIKSDKYSLKGKTSLATVMLTLLGIDKPPKLIVSQNRGQQTLSWRNVWRLSVVSESKIINKKSILLPEQSTAISAEIMTLIYLATGEDYHSEIPEDDLGTRHIAISAVEEYLRNEIKYMADLIENYSEDQSGDTFTIEQEIDEISQELLEANKKLQLSVKRNKEIAQEIIDLNLRLDRLQMMNGRYLELKSQYLADLKRLNFIADTAVHGYPDHIANCPFCNSKVELKNDTSYVKAAQSEYRRIKSQLVDLEKAIQDIEEEKNKLQQDIETRQKSFNDAKNIIDSELQPKSLHLESKLSNYTEMLKRSASIQCLKDQSSRMTDKVAELANEDTAQDKFKIKEHLSDDIIDNLTNYWKEALPRCSFENYNSCYFDRKTMDIVVNMEKKQYYGKGYRAFLNTVVALGVILYLRNKGKFSLPLLLVDSPILSLKEDVEEKERATAPMRNGLFNEFAINQSELQIIVIENDIPEVVYGDANIIHFTKSKEHGRYGFLEGVYN